MLVLFLPYFVFIINISMTSVRIIPDFFALVWLLIMLTTKTFRNVNYNINRLDSFKLPVGISIFKLI